MTEKEVNAVTMEPQEKADALFLQSKQRNSWMTRELFDQIDSVFPNEPLTLDEIETEAIKILSGETETP